MSPEQAQPCAGISRHRCLGERHGRAHCWPVKGLMFPKKGTEPCSMIVGCNSDSGNQGERGTFPHLHSTPRLQGKQSSALSRPLAPRCSSPSHSLARPVEDQPLYRAHGNTLPPSTQQCNPLPLPFTRSLELPLSRPAATA